MFLVLQINCDKRVNCKVKHVPYLEFDRFVHDLALIFHLASNENACRRLTIYYQKILVKQHFLMRNCWINKSMLLKLKFNRKLSSLKKFYSLHRITTRIDVISTEMSNAPFAKKKKKCCVMCKSLVLFTLSHFSF